MHAQELDVDSNIPSRPYPLIRLYMVWLPFWHGGFEFSASLLSQLSQYQAGLVKSHHLHSTADVYQPWEVTSFLWNGSKKNVCQTAKETTYWYVITEMSIWKQQRICGALQALVDIFPSTFFEVKKRNTSKLKLREIPAPTELNAPTRFVPLSRTVRTRKVPRKIMGQRAPE